MYFNVCNHIIVFVTASQVVLNENQCLEDGQLIAEDLRKKLEVCESDLITGAYMDLILQKKQEH